MSVEFPEGKALQLRDHRHGNEIRKWQFVERGKLVRILRIFMICQQVVQEIFSV